jgi:SAM-dependent methyltransferase
MSDNSYNYRDDWDDIHQNKTPKPWEEGEIARQLKDFFENPDNFDRYKNARIIDVGCGNGKLCEYLASYGYENVTGIDVSEYIIYSSCSSSKSKVTYKVKDIVNDDFPINKDNQYDIVICWFVLHHIIGEEDVIKFIFNLSKLCKTGGILMISFRSTANGKEGVTPSHFSKYPEHLVHLYEVAQVEKMFSSFFDIIRNPLDDDELLAKPDIHGETYPYYVLKMQKRKKHELALDILDFKKRYILPESGIYDSKSNLDVQTDKMISLLNNFSNLSVDELSESEYLEVFQSLFRNVSRFVCKMITDSLGNKKDVIILKMDTHSPMYSAAKWLKIKDENYSRPHCRLNDYKNKVQSRAYDLFYKYLDFSKTLKIKPYSLHHHFSEDPSKKYVAFSVEQGQLKQYDIDGNTISIEDEIKDSNYLFFLGSILNGEKYCKSGSNSKIIGSKDFETYIQIHGTINRNKPTKSFSCFNLGIPGFESWGTLMIEGVDSDVETVKNCFFDAKGADKALLHDIKNIFFIIKKIDYDYYDALAAKMVKIQAIKSAIAALMSRNMSHNLGSHFLTNTKNYFRKRIDEVTSTEKPQKNLIGADYRGNVHLLQYLKERMDFIATIVSGDHYPYGSLNFKAQLFDVLTEDDHGKRHGKSVQNFLLKYLVFSEQLTRRERDTKNLLDKKKYYNLLLEVLFPNASGFIIEGNQTIYTGKNVKQIEENELRLLLSSIEIAVPGGLMARHAFFTIVENIIRNSAKHSKANEDLIITLELKKTEQNLSITVHDNRKAGEKVKQEIETRFKDLLILKGNDNRVDKESKGLKEMLICAMWLNNEDVAERLYEIQNKTEKEAKLKLIKKFIDVSNDAEGNLCYTLITPLFETCHRLKKGMDYLNNGVDRISLISDNLVKVHSDIIVADQDFVVDNQRRLSEIFPRFVPLNELSADAKQKWDEAIKAKSRVDLFRLLKIKENLDNGVISVDYTKFGKKNIQDDEGGISVKRGSIKDEDWTIFFQDHLETNISKSILSKTVKEKKDKYLESISGENYTSTIATFDFLSDPVNRFKVVEAANTRIAIIDERIFGDYKTRYGKDIDLEMRVLEMRGISLYDFDPKFKNLIQLSGKRLNKKKMDFITIHLGLIEKYKGSKKIIDFLENKFGTGNSKPFIAIHSGRGNFSPELEDELRNYPFISLSALEAAFYDCKYFLTQLFKNTNYYGKGNYNNE